MNSEEKEISYRITNSYSVLNKFTEKTKIVWFVCHGMGHLSKYFIKNFERLNKDENFIIAPQAQSKYYLSSKSKYIGASWLTKVNTIKETQNVLRYFDTIFTYENFIGNFKLNVLGYSQGVSVAMRFVASRKIIVNKLILVSGGIPIELETDDFKHFSSNTEVHSIYGTEDEYIDANRIKTENVKLNSLFKNNVSQHTFKAGHDFNVEIFIKLFN